MPTTYATAEPEITIVTTEPIPLPVCADRCPMTGGACPAGGDPNCTSC